MGWFYLRFCRGYGVLGQYVCLNASYHPTGSTAKSLQPMTEPAMPNSGSL